MRKLLLMLTMTLLFLMGCTSTKDLAPAEKTQMRTKTYESDYETAYRATMSVLENQGYTIDNTDMASGLIRANIAKDEYSKGNKIASALFLGVNKSGIKTYDLSSTVTKISNSSTKVRVNVSLKTERKANLSSSSSSEEVNNPEIYNVLLNEIQLEIARMQAMNK